MFFLTRFSERTDRSHTLLHSWRQDTTRRIPTILCALQTRKCCAGSQWKSIQRKNYICGELRVEIYSSSQECVPVRSLAYAMQHVVHLDHEQMCCLLLLLHNSDPLLLLCACVRAFLCVFIFQQFNELRQFFEQHGVLLQSTVDSELFLHLISHRCVYCLRFVQSFW